MSRRHKLTVWDLMTTDQLIRLEKALGRAVRFADAEKSGIKRKRKAH
ncbi:MAG: hypothetical protein WCB19_04060 [Thermoplasmata archaeon]